MSKGNQFEKLTSKVILVGSSNVGKTSLFSQLTNKNFSAYRIPTVGNFTKF